MPSSASLRSQHAILAALARSAKAPSGQAMTEAARRTFRESFDTRHECSLCDLIEIDQSLPADQRRRQADAAYKLHMTRVRHTRDQRHRRELEARREAYAAQKLAEAELAGLDNAV